MISAWVVELVDTQDLKSCGSDAVAVRFRSRVQKEDKWSSFFIHNHGCSLYPLF